MADHSDRFLRYLADEREAARTYRALAELATGDRRAALLELAAIEDRHAEHWAGLLRQRGTAVPPVDPGRPPEHAHLLARARALGLDVVLAELEQAERDAQGVYDAEAFAAPGMAEDERAHERTLRGLREAGPGAAEPVGGVGDQPVDEAALRRGLSESEPWHRADKSGTLRAAIFGVSDGLVSNAALIMGFAGSGVANSTVAFAGVAGLLAGAFSMAAGEYVSVAGQRDVFARELRLEAQELAEHPEEEARELELLYRAKGMDRELARAAAAKILEDPQVALDTLAREELGLDPGDLGSPVRVAVSSFTAFAVGAAIPLLPFALVAGTAAMAVAIVLTALALLGVGALVGRLSGAGVVRSAMRQFAVGAAAAGVTYLIGRAIGGSVGVG
ncbi:MAG: VIT1/CCC1 transporter family protein [Candidatus Nanopelagicales bacterium]|nr:VIT1/CCC1 transporter family protein [Candidatus Nanopelagicales bacterium]